MFASSRVCGAAVVAAMWLARKWKIIVVTAETNVIRYLILVCIFEILAGDATRALTTHMQYTFIHSLSTRIVSLFTDFISSKSNARTRLLSSFLFRVLKICELKNAPEGGARVFRCVPVYRIRQYFGQIQTRLNVDVVAGYAGSPRRTHMATMLNWMLPDAPTVRVRCTEINNFPSFDWSSVSNYLWWNFAAAIDRQQNAIIILLMVLLPHTKRS